MRSKLNQSNEKSEIATRQDPSPSCINASIQDPRWIAGEVCSRTIAAAAAHRRLARRCVAVLLARAHDASRYPRGRLRHSRMSTNDA